MMVVWTTKTLRAARSVEKNLRSPTHFLGLPLCNAKSKAKLDFIVHTLRSDELTREIPPKAFRFPQSFYSKILSFSVATTDGVKDAIRTLKGFDVEKALAADSSGSKSTFASISDISTEGGHCDDVCLTKAQPLKVDLRGFSSIASSSHHYASIDDQSDRMRFFFASVRQHFRARGYMYVEEHSRNHLRLFPQDSGRGVLGPNLINLRKGKPYRMVMDWNDEVAKKRKADRAIIQKLIDKYTDTVWAKDIEIEKISLCKAGRKATFLGPDDDMLVDEEYEEIASIRLPRGT